MDWTLYALVAMVSHWFRPRYNTRIQMLEFQIRIRGFDSRRLHHFLLALSP